MKKKRRETKRVFFSRLTDSLTREERPGRRRLTRRERAFWNSQDATRGLSSPVNHLELRAPTTSELACGDRGATFFFKAEREFPRAARARALERERERDAARSRASTVRSVSCFGHKKTRFFYFSTEFQRSSQTKFSRKSRRAQLGAGCRGVERVHARRPLDRRQGVGEFSRRRVRARGNFDRDSSRLSYTGFFGALSSLRSADFFYVRLRQSSRAVSVDVSFCACREHDERGLLKRARRAYLSGESGVLRVARIDRLKAGPIEASPVGR